jgi:hypothetical protein
MKLKKSFSFKNQIFKVFFFAAVGFVVAAVVAVAVVVAVADKIKCVGLTDQ